MLLLLRLVHKSAELTLPEKNSQCFDDDTAIGDHTATPKILFRQNYFEVLDFITNYIRSQFKQPKYNKNLQEVLFQAIKGQDFEFDMQYVSQFYNDVDYKANLKCQFQIFAMDCPNKNTAQQHIQYKSRVAGWSS